MCRTIYMVGVALFLAILAVGATSLQVLVMGQQTKCLTLHFEDNQTLTTIEVEAPPDIESILKDNSEPTGTQPINRRLNVRLDDRAELCFHNSYPLERSVLFTYYPFVGKETRSVATNRQVRGVQKLLTETKALLEHSRKEIMRKRQTEAIGNNNESLSALLSAMLSDAIWIVTACGFILLMQVAVFSRALKLKSKTDKHG